MGYDTNCDVLIGYIIPLKEFPNSDEYVDKNVGDVESTISGKIKYQAHVFNWKDREEYNNDEKEYITTSSDKIFVGLEFQGKEDDKTIQQTNANSMSSGCGLSITTWGHSAIFDKFSGISVDDFLQQLHSKKAKLELAISKAFPNLTLSNYPCIIAQHQNGN